MVLPLHSMFLYFFLEPAFVFKVRHVKSGWDEYADIERAPPLQDTSTAFSAGPPSDFYHKPTSFVGGRAPTALEAFSRE